VTGVELRVSDTTNCPTDTDSGANTEVLGSSTGARGNVTGKSSREIAALLGIPCTQGSLLTFQVCAVGTGTPTTSTPTQSGSLQMDFVRPVAPTITGVSPGEGSLNVSWNVASSAERYVVTATPRGGGTVVSTDPDGVTGTSHRVVGVVNGTTYDVTVVGLSAGGNEGAPSAPVEGTPADVNDFWEYYRGKGGRDHGGCSTTGGGALSLLALAPFVLRRKRK
jgi:Synergist-CTERM protein sorting domain-containing protein